MLPSYQNRTLILLLTGGLKQPDWSPCTDYRTAECRLGLIATGISMIIDLLFDSFQNPWLIKVKKNLLLILWSQIRPSPSAGT